MNGFEGALEFSLSVKMYLLRFVLAALVLWLIVGGLKETTVTALERGRGKDVHPMGPVA